MMELREIQMGRWEALGHLQQYRKALRGKKERERSREDRDTMKALLALSRKQRLVSLARIFQVCPVDDRLRPKLAIVRADSREVLLHTNGWDLVFYHMKPNHWGPTNQDQKLVVRARQHTPWSRWTALTPTIPPWLRPPNLSDYFILWEAEWRAGVAPGDPALPKRITQDLFVVLATWDLSPVEKAVLEAARA